MKRESANLQRKVDVLSKTFLFGGSDEASLRSLAELASWQQAPPRTVIVREQEPGREIYVAASGFLKISMMSADGREVGLNLIKPVDVFGEVAVFDRGVRSATVTSVTHVQLLVIDQGPFLELLRSSPDLCIRLLGVLARRVRDLSSDVSGMRVGQRLARRILQLAEEAEENRGIGGIPMAVRLSQTELGELARATRESVNQHISLWVREGILEMSNGQLVVHAPARLRALADGLVELPLEARLLRR